MENKNRLPNVIFMSPKISELLGTLITEDGAYIESDSKGIDIRNLSSFDDDVDKNPNIATFFNCGILPENNRIA